MNTTLPRENEKIGGNGHHHDAEIVEQIKRRARARKVQAAKKLAERLQIAPDGSRQFVRFKRNQRIEHQLLIATFTTLALTGLLQRYSANLVVGWIINNLFGGIESLRTVHHLAAAIFIFEAVYHVGFILYVWLVKREFGSMWPRVQDIKDLFGTMGYNLRLVRKKPESDHFSVEEKIEYWALLWGTVVMIITGLVQWFPLLVTRVLPGSTIPISRVVHSWEAVLATLSIAAWHMYHTVIKERNRSIFSGLMDEEEMAESHPLEYRRILASRDYLNWLATNPHVPVGEPVEEQVGVPEQTSAGDSNYELVEAHATD